MFPLSTPALVRLVFPSALAIPKSVTRTVPSKPIKMFCGDTSRWTRRRTVPSSDLTSCAACKPIAASRPIRTATCIGNGRLALAASVMTRERETPSTKSMMRKGPS